MTDRLDDLRAALSLLSEAQAELALPDPWADRLSRSLADYGAAVEEFAAALSWGGAKTEPERSKRTKEQWRDVLVKAGKRNDGFTARDLAKELDCGVIPLTEALRQEYRALQARVEQSRERAERLRGLAEQAEAQASGEEKLLRDLAGVLGLSAQTSLDELDGRLRGQRLREVAVEVLRDQHQSGEPIHYRAWFELVRGQGYAVAGKDPLATFLAQVSRADEVEQVGRRSGLYLLRAS